DSRHRRVRLLIGRFDPHMFVDIATPAFIPALIARCVGEIGAEAGSRTLGGKPIHEVALLRISCADGSKIERSVPAPSEIWGTHSSGAVLCRCVYQWNSLARTWRCGGSANHIWRFALEIRFVCVMPRAIDFTRFRRRCPDEKRRRGFRKTGHCLRQGEWSEQVSQ